MKTKMPKFTFRKEPRETGLSAVGRPYPSTEIKLGGKVVGRIAAPYHGTPGRKWGLGLIVADPDGENCPWRWAFFNARFDDEPSARAWLMQHQAKLSETYTIVSADYEPSAPIETEGGDAKQGSVAKP